MWTLSTQQLITHRKHHQPTTTPDRSNTVTECQSQRHAAASVHVTCDRAVKTNIWAWRLRVALGWQGPWPGLLPERLLELIIGEQSKARQRCREATKALPQTQGMFNASRKLTKLKPVQQTRKLTKLKPVQRKKSKPKKNTSCPRSTRECVGIMRCEDASHKFFPLPDTFPCPRRDQPGSLQKK